MSVRPVPFRQWIGAFEQGATSACLIHGSDLRHIKDAEAARIAIFRMEQCSNGLRELSGQVQSPALRKRLQILSRKLTAFANELAESALDPALDE
jgi:hypothetical protein